MRHNCDDLTELALVAMSSELAGRLTLTVVSNEETGGRWGAGSLVEHNPDRVLGDCLLNSEPSSPWTIRFGENSPSWFRFHIHIKGAPSAYPHLSKSATRIAARLMIDLETLEDIPVALSAFVARVLSRPETHAAIERALGKGANEVLPKITVNAGMISGGIKLNLLPGDVTLEVDIRVPVGATAAQMRAAVQAIAARYPEMTVEERQTCTIDPTFSDREHEMIGRRADATESLQGVRPQPMINLGEPDCRFWRIKGVPAYVFGCSPDGMGMPDELVSVDEFRLVLRTHVLAAAAYLGAGRS